MRKKMTEKEPTGTDETVILCVKINAIAKERTWAEKGLRKCNRRKRIRREREREYTYGYSERLKQ